jgi:general secretion pathway protein N
MRLRALAIAGVIAYVLFLVALIPASFVAERVTAATGGRVAIANAGGTLWNGAARVRLTLAGGWLDLDNVEWHFAPLELGVGRLAFDTSATAQGIDAKARVGRAFGGWELANMELTASLPAIATLAPVAARWRPEGRLTVDAPKWEWNDRGARGEATVEWRDAALSLSEVKPLGSYRAVATGDGALTQLAVKTLGGQLQVNGKGSAGPALVTFSGEARPSDSSVAKALEPLLDLMGPRRPDGARSLELRIGL